MKTHWKKLTNPNYLGAYSIEDGHDLILTIKNVREEQVIGADGKKDDCVVCYFYENVKPMILNATNMKTIAKLYRTNYIEEWVGKKIRIGVEQVKAFGDIVDALRVKKVIPAAENKSERISCSDCGNAIKPANGFDSRQLAAYTAKKYGRELCAACATKAAQTLKDGETIVDK